ncbi:MAG: hypothetical protein WA138_10955 [Parvibaculum sp.]
MTIAEYFESLSVESLILLLGFCGLMAIVIGLHVRNLRWVREINNAQASTEARKRIETLISKVEKLAEKPNGGANRAKPVGKGRKFVPAARTTKTSIPVLRSR